MLRVELKPTMWQNLVYRLINQPVRTNPWHHATELLTNLLDRMFGIPAFRVCINNGWGP